VQTISSASRRWSDHSPCLLLPIAPESVWGSYLEAILQLRWRLIALKETVIGGKIIHILRITYPKHSLTDVKFPLCAFIFRVLLAEKFPAYNPSSYGHPL